MNKFLLKPTQVDDMEAWLVAWFGDVHTRHALVITARASNDTHTRPTRHTQPSAPHNVRTLTTPITVMPQGSAPPRRRFRANDVSTHLDMTVIGDVCVGVSLAGYRSVLLSFLSDETGSQAALLAALAAGHTASLPALSHTVKGAAASMGMRAIQALARKIEIEGAQFSADDCAAALVSMREHINTAQALLRRMGFI